jgi:site-specific recombinase XerD
VIVLKRSDFVTLPPLLVDYLRYLEVVKNKSDLTVLEYASDIRIFLRYILKSKGLVSNDTLFDEINISGVDLNLLKSINIMDAYAFLSYCRSERKNDVAIRARRTIAIKRFFRYLTVNMKLLDENPLQELDSPKLKKALPKYLTLEQSLDLLACVDGKFKERDYCILTLFLNCGLRLAELVGLNCSDIRSDNTIKVTGKGNKERTLYLNNACVSAIERYLEVRPVEGVKDRNALFISRNKCRISPRTVENIVNHFIIKAGLDGQGFSVHKLRHTAATLMYQYGNVDILLIKEILGHENLSTTEIYTHVVDEQLRKAVESNPLGNLKTDKN